jgi:hypothetical protein
MRNAEQCLKYSDVRRRPFADLLAQPSARHSPRKSPKGDKGVETKGSGAFPLEERWAETTQGGTLALEKAADPFDSPQGHKPTREGPMARSAAWRIAWPGDCGILCLIQMA